MYLPLVGPMPSVASRTKLDPVLACLNTSAILTKDAGRNAHSTRTAPLTRPVSITSALVRVQELALRTPTVKLSTTCPVAAAT